MISTTTRSLTSQWSITDRAEAMMKDEGDRARDPEGTRAAVLDAAERLFAEDGFASTSMR